MTLRAIAETTPISADQVIIGHDILSLISSAMYVEPMIIYRELIQNAADAIDEAVSLGRLKPSQGRVDLMIDPLHRQVIMRDNGAGVANDQFVQTMCAIGSSPKRGTKARGFRGIGRLVGLGYSQELVLRSRSHQHERVMEAVWDARLLRDLLRSKQRAPLDEVVASVVKVTSRDAASGEPPHFFDVELRKVVRLTDDRLLNTAAVERYLSEVAPVPFCADFVLGKQIVDFLRSHGSYPLLDVRVNGAQPLTRPHQNSIAITSSKIAHITGFDPITIPAYDDGSRIAAVAWIAKHEYFGAIPRRLGVRGLRARIGNLQIGDDRAFAEAFPEERFSDWSIGEVHIYDHSITPNGRRDGFEPSLHLSNLIGHLHVTAREIGRSARYSSVERRMERGLVSVNAALKDYTRFLKVSPEAYALRDELFADVLAEMEKARRRLIGSDRQHWEQKIAALEKQMEKAKKIKGNHGPKIRERSRGRVEVLKALRNQIPGGLPIATTLLKILAKSD